MHTFVTLETLISLDNLCKKKARSVEPGVAPTKWKNTLHGDPLKNKMNKYFYLQDIRV